MTFKKEIIPDIGKDDVDERAKDIDQILDLKVNESGSFISNNIKAWKTAFYTVQKNSDANADKKFSFRADKENDKKFFVIRIK